MATLLALGCHCGCGVAPYSRHGIQDNVALLPPLSYATKAGDTKNTMNCQPVYSQHLLLGENLRKKNLTLRQGNGSVVEHTFQIWNIPELIPDSFKWKTLEDNISQFRQ